MQGCACVGVGVGLSFLSPPLPVCLLALLLIYLSFYMLAVFFPLSLCQAAANKVRNSAGGCFFTTWPHTQPRGDHPIVSSGNKRGKSGVQPVARVLHLYPVNSLLGSPALTC